MGIQDARLRRARRRGAWQTSSEPQRIAPREPVVIGSSPGREHDAHRFWIIVPCKGRLSFLRQTAWRVIEHTPFNVCLVDFSCPDRCGDWLEREYPDSPDGRRIVVERVPGRRDFNKSAAHNAGAWRALSQGAEYLCFLDADTMVHEGFGEHVSRLVRRDRFLIAALRDDGFDMPSMTGLLVVCAYRFRDLGGFDEEFEGWGGEDIEMRLRLHLVGGLGYADVPLHLASPIPHDNVLRTQYYQETSIFASNRQNMERVRNKIAYWGGAPAGAERLWFRGMGRGGAAAAHVTPRQRTGRPDREHPVRSVARRLGREGQPGMIRARGRR